MNDRIIKFEKIKNARELGGLTAFEGKHIKHNLLIRCGQIGNASQGDIAVLVNKYKLEHIIDLRIGVEIEEKPDVTVTGAQYENLPVLDESIFGISRDKYSFESWLNLFSGNENNPETVFGEMYKKILFNERVIPFVQRFFNVLLDSRNGAVLWHCSAGKDRVGVMTFLLLSALGVSEKDILDDYMLTRADSMAEFNKIKYLLPIKISNKALRNCVYVLFDVKEKYISDIIEDINRDYGNTEQFLIKRFGITQSQINALREKYLE